MASQKQKNFIDKIGPVAQKVCKERGYGNASLWTAICQAALETGWGSSGLMTKANAFFGIKATGWKGKVYSSATNEVYNGVTYNINANFRAYDSLEDGVKDYFDLISGARYSASLKAKTVSECVTIIKNGGYATDPTYISKIVSIYTDCRPEIEKYKVTGTVSTPVSKPVANKLPGYTGLITYQSYANTKGWLGEIKSTTGTGTNAYSGYLGFPISGIRAKAEYGEIIIQSHVLGEPRDTWLGKISKYSKSSNDGTTYSGIVGKPIDCIKIWSETGHVDFRVHIKGGGWLDWIDSRNCNGTGTNSYAGIYGKEIDAIQMK